MKGIQVYHREMDTATVTSLWGDYSSRALVFVSAIGVGAAIAAGMYARRVYEIERGRDESRLIQETRSQAVLVSAWAELERKPVSEIAFDLHLNAVAFNGSDEPIYDVEITWFIDEVVVQTENSNLIPPKEKKRWLPVFGEFPKRSNLRQVEENEGASELARNSRIVISFTDANSRHWIRDKAGNLSQIKEA